MKARGAAAGEPKNCPKLEQCARGAESCADSLFRILNKLVILVYAALTATVTSSRGTHASRPTPAPGP